MGSCLLSVLTGLILMQIQQNSECYKIEVSPHPGTTVVFRRKGGQDLDCTACRGVGSSVTCQNSDLKLDESVLTTVNFNCSQPADVFNVEVTQNIECFETRCKNIAIHPDSTRFLDFTRTFIWDVKVPLSNTVQLDFPAPAIRQIKPSEYCPNNHTYTIISYRAGRTSIGTFCMNGTISRIQVLYRGRVSLEVQKGTDLNPSDFKVSVGPESKMLVEVDSKLPRGESFEDFFTPEYTKGFLRDDQIKWNFAVEPSHNFSVKYLHKTEPECQTGDVSIEYLFEDKSVLTKTLKDDPPANKNGDFSMTLANCQPKTGLALNFEVSVFRGGTPKLCKVDLQNEEGLSLQVEKKNPMSYCEMKMNSLVQEKTVIHVGSKVELSFLDCSAEDLMLMATKTIVLDCPRGPPCDVRSTDLTIPAPVSCLPALHQFTWLLRVPEGSIDLSSLQGNLHQSVPEKECNQVTFLVSEIGGSNIGQFCSDGEGTIQKIQIKGNASITAMPKGAQGLSQEKRPLLKAILNPEFSENVVYSVSPLVMGSTYLPTPNWPDGMMPSTSVTWTVLVPSDYRAEIVFTNVSQPKCASGHTVVKIQSADSHEFQFWTEDQTFPSMVIQQQSFYLNMSNCEPKSGRFAVLSKIILQRETRKFLGIILAVVGILLLLLIVVLIVVCVIRKKKKPRANRSSIFMPRGRSNLPGNATFPKTRADNESHIYASIEDQPVVDVNSGHWGNGHQVDTYRPYTGPTDSIPAVKESSPEYTLDRGDGRSEDQDTYQPFLNPTSTFMPARPRTPLISVSSLRFEDRRMAQNELNTFKSTGDINPIRLSTDESRFQPQLDSDSDSFHEPEYDETQ
ncbi:CUB domain-containing protein 1 [Triplophysa tibetana]|uniref:CUB domain-containing protein 1 n=1 Tax=Triplophysa tibetana TaxID=1572043 RepID=A0A5A9NNZ7_9TELE|nr:CUB domain-containing protein 1 [Triplophysa tibetana]